MLKERYIDQIKKYTHMFFPKNKAFIFGSSLREGHYSDVDVAIQGKLDPTDFRLLRTVFEETALPFTVDLVPFDSARESFRNYVLDKEKKLWL